jgi:uncharacterized protein YodC (DUF2158 family)
MTESFTPGDIVYHKLSGEKMIITNAAHFADSEEKQWHCRFQTTMGRYEGKVFVESELSKDKV